MNPTAPRVYVYRKSGRTVWDVEIWLPDGKRKTWRSGLHDRESALRAGHERARAWLALPDAEVPGLVPVIPEAVSPTIPERCLVGDPTPFHTLPIEAPRQMVRCCDLPPITSAPTRVVPGEPTARASLSLQGLLARFDRWFWGQLSLR